MKYTVYQINEERDKNRLLFMNYERTMRDVGKIDMEIYDKVYEGKIPVRAGEVDTEKILEGIYTDLNERTMRDVGKIDMARGEHKRFRRGRSLSVSDVVELPSGRWFCDSVGWQKVS